MDSYFWFLREDINEVHSENHLSSRATGYIAANQAISIEQVKKKKKGRRRKKKKSTTKLVRIIVAVIFYIKNVFETASKICW